MKYLVLPRFCRVLALLLSVTSLSSASVLTVINLNDSGPGSLRQAILSAAGGDTINFANNVTGTITLTSGELLITNGLTLNGPGASTLTISGNNASRVIHTSGSVLIQISGLTIAHGNTNGSGGGIYQENGTILTVSGCTISKNTSFSGGGVCEAYGWVNLVNCLISSNTATSLYGSGGGIYHASGTLFLLGSTVSGNSAVYGGGIYLGAYDHFVNSTIAANHASLAGGGIYGVGSAFEMTNCTVVQNTGFSPGIGIYFIAGTPTVGNCIIAGNTGSGVNADCYGTFGSLGFNLIGAINGSTGWGGLGDQIGTSGSPINPLLGPLQDNGGPTPTMVPTSLSPVIDQGKSFGVTTDQRGFVRPFDYPSIPNAAGGDGSDIGAVEAGSSPTNSGYGVSQVNVDASQTVRVADARWFGVNTAIWDSHFDTPSTAAALNELGCRTLRFPGGSLSDFYHWATGTRDDGYPYDPTKFSNFMHVATNAAAQVFITVNYGTGTPDEAAGWVLSANVTNQCGFKYWEVGNECYGSWEADNNTNAAYLAHDPWTYAMRFADYYTQMKAADPTIKIGIVVVPGEDNYANNLSHSAYNPRTGLTHYGWTPVLLSTLQSLGVTPDFVVHHFYPEYLVDNDAALLQAASNWAGDAADLRQQITDYFGDGGNIELLCTENNADAGSQGRQSTSIVNALYLADSLNQLMKTEFNSFVWWDLRNGVDTGGDFDPSLYGWRTNGDLGIMVNADTRYPTFYGMKLMQYFVRPGDTVLNATSDNPLLSTYAAQRTDGTLTLLIINKNATAVYDAQIALANFSPWPTATVRSYGIQQDEAARTNGPAAAQDIALTYYLSASANFTYSCPPYSLTLFTFASSDSVPTAPQLNLLPAAAGQFTFQVLGQAYVPYVIQSSTDLSTWTSVETNILIEGTLNVTNPVSPDTPQQFWRALWQP